MNVNKEDYNDRVAAKGSTYAIYIHYILLPQIYFKGTKVEMEVLEDKFVAGEWIPSFIQPSPAPKQKRKQNIQQQQKKKKTKKQEKKKIKDRMPFNHLVELTSL